MKKLLPLALAAVMAASILPMTAAAEETAIVTDGLVAYYDGANNANGSQNKETDVWADLSGKGLDFEVDLDDTNYWTDNSFHVDSAYNYFPDEIVDLVNGDKFTVEIALGELEYPGTSYISFIISDNDNFSLFIRTDGDFIEFKGSGNARPKVEGGAEFANNSTLAITFDIDGDVCMYVDGECIGSAMTTENIVADTLFLGHYDAARNWVGDVYSIRFYDRALTAEEVAQNAAADNAKYRGAAAEEAPAEAAEETPVVEETPVEEPAEAVEEVPAVEVEEEPAEEIVETVEEEPQVVEEAPQTFDMGIVAAVAAIISAAGYAVSKKR